MCYVEPMKYVLKTNYFNLIWYADHIAVVKWVN